MIAAPPAGVEITAYRDHCVWREGTKWRQLVGGSGIRHRGGTAFLYESSDLRSWDYIGPLCIGDASQGDPADTDWTGTMWECVDLFRAGQGSLGSAPTDNSPDVLVFSAWDDGVTRHPLYWTGRYAGDAFEPEALHRLDYGGRFFYAPQSFEDESGRRVMFGWMQEGRSDAAMVEAGWSGVMSSHGSPPWPTMEPWSLRRFPKLRSCAETTSPSPARCWQGGLERPLRPVHPQPGGPGAGPAACAWCGGSAGSADVSGRCRGDRDSAESGRRWHPPSALCAWIVPAAASTLPSMWRTSPAPVPMMDGRVRLRVVVDRSAVEIFANGKPLTARVYPTLGGERVTLAATEGSARLLTFDAWTMAGIFESTRSLLPEGK